MGTAVNRRFAAWSSTSHLPSPKAEGFIATQNLHGLESPDMVIVTPEAFKAQAQRLAELHANSSDSLVVAVAILEHVYNEFSGGHADPVACGISSKCFTTVAPPAPDALCAMPC